MGCIRLEVYMHEYPSCPPARRVSVARSFFSPLAHLILVAFSHLWRMRSTLESKLDAQAAQRVKKQQKQRRQKQEDVRGPSVAGWPAANHPSGTHPHAMLCIRP